MLPKIERTSYPTGYDRRLAEQRLLHQMLNIEMDDNVTTPNAVGIVKELNAYTYRATEYVYKVMACISFYEGIYAGYFDDSDIPFVAPYKRPEIKDFAERTKGRLWHIAISVAKQKSLAVVVKVKVKKNRISKDWEKLLYRFIRSLNDRIDYLDGIVLPEHMSFTPVCFFIDELKKEGRTLFDFFQHTTPVDDYKRSSEYLSDKAKEITEDIISFLMSAATDETMAEWTKGLEDAVSARIHRDEVNYEAHKQYENEVREKVKVRARNDLITYSGYADKLVKARKKGTLKKWCRTYNLYAVVFARLNRSLAHTDLYWLKSKTSCSGSADFSKAAIFTDENEAKTMVAKLERDPNVIAEIAYIDNSASGYEKNHPA